jgi:hypothetical protein
MLLGVQFSGSLGAGASDTWFSEGWGDHWGTTFTVVPTSPVYDQGPQLEWDTRSEPGVPSTLTWFFTVRNLTQRPLDFEVRYAIP